MALEEKKDVYAAQTLFREIGYYQKNKQLFRESLPAFSEAHKRAPDDLRLLLGSSWSKVKTFKYDGAYKDISRASRLYPDDLRVQQLRARVVYFRNNFEDALVENCRGEPIRRKPDVFITGSMQCADVIETAIGDDARHALRDHYDHIRMIAWKRALDARKPFQPKPRLKRKKKHIMLDDTPTVYTKRMQLAKELKEIPSCSDLSILDSFTQIKGNQIDIPYKEKSPDQPPQRRVKNIERILSCKYLGRMATQKEFVQNLITDSRLVCPNEDGTKKLIHLAKSAYKKVGICQESLRARKPFYSIKYAEIASAAGRSMWKANEIRLLQQITENYVLDLMRNMSVMFRNKRTNKCIRIAYIIKEFAEKKSLKLLPRKQMFLETVYELIGLIYLDTYRYREEGTEEYNKRRFNFLFGFPLRREPSNDSVYYNTKQVYTDVMQMRATAQMRLKNSTTPLEAVWLYYELALIEFELKHWDLCQFYALKAQQMAEILQNWPWVTCAGMLVAKTHLQQRDKHETIVELEKLKTTAKQMGSELMLKFIDESMRMVESFDYNAIPTISAEKKREKELLSIIEDNQIYKEVEHLFKEMENIPLNRRLALTTGLKTQEAESRRKLRPDASIRPFCEPEYRAALEDTRTTFNMFDYTLPE